MEFIKLKLNYGSKTPTILINLTFIVTIMKGKGNKGCIIKTFTKEFTVINSFADVKVMVGV